MMMNSFRLQFVLAAARKARRTVMIAAPSMLFLFLCPLAGAQSPNTLLASRADLMAAATRAETAAMTGDPGARAQQAMVAASVRQRLRDGDFQVGDRVVVTIVSDAVHRDTVVVRPERSLQLPGMIVVPVAGVLRSELHERVATEVLKYVKAQQIEVVPLMRVAILGAVGRPGYFALASDIPLTDAIMTAGGPSPSADIDRSFVRRGNQEFRSSNETRKAIASGLTLDQFGLTGGDELVVGQRRDFGPSTILGITGGLASLVTIYVALHRR